MASASYGSVPFREQIEFFRRKLNITTEAWTDVMEAEHDVAFMVAGANRDDLVADFREAIRRAIEDGATLAQFRQDFDAIVERHGWDYNGGRNWRSRVIYETNLRQSYNAGRWQQLQEIKAVRPYWRYRHSDAVQHPRPIHESWHGLILHADDPWWHTHFPANGWGCQCYVEGLSERDLVRLGKSGPDTAPPVVMEAVTVGARSPGGPRTILTPEGIDPGFGYAPGRSLQLRVARSAQTALAKTLQLPAELAAESADGILSLSTVVDALVDGFRDWLASAVAVLPMPDSRYLVGAIAPGLRERLATAGVEVAAAPIAVDLVAARLATAAAEFGVSQASLVPAMLRRPLAVLLDRAAGELVFVGRANGSALAVRVGLGSIGEPNIAYRIDELQRGALQAEVALGRLQLLQGTLEG